MRKYKLKVDNNNLEVLVDNMHHLIPGLVVELLNSTDTDITGISMEQKNLDNLYPALVQCFGIILLGFLAGKFSFITDVEARGLSTFVGTFSLPALIFVSFFCFH